MRSLIAAFRAQWMALPADKRVVIVHPNFHYQNLVLTDLIAGGVYVRFVGDSLSMDELAAQMPVLHEHAAPLQTLVLDEIECAQPEVLHDFVERVLQTGAYQRVAVIPRSLPNQLIHSGELRHLVAVIPVDGRGIMFDYTTLQAHETLLEVTAFGMGQVLCNGRFITQWDSDNDTRTRELFHFLLDRRPVAREAILEAIWFELPTEKAINSFHVTKGKIVNRALKLPKGQQFVSYRNRVYDIVPEISLVYDVAVFRDLIARSEVADDPTEVLERAVDLYRADFLTSLDRGWANEIRDTLRQQCCEAFIKLGDLYRQRGESKLALNRFLRAARLNHLREDAARGAMEMYAALNMPADGLRVYDRLANAIRTRYRTEPSPPTQAAAERLRKLLGD